MGRVEAGKATKQMGSNAGMTLTSQSEQMLHVLPAAKCSFSFSHVSQLSVLEYYL